MQKLNAIHDASGKASGVHMGVRTTDLKKPVG